ncbi:hypothetical protein [Clostridium gasigenes]|uniref:RDD family protein n=1 Tax=Clostridium gasigenes TaxID=94869 RepID=A0A1H0S1J9_9CLOT|nr:hypothetical protein [Clostridium gasigenes]MBB6622695.1 hypothetical protein [Clostridium gasigenes]MBU3088627.1 hypothetical protein [Clostridium gasigenes]NKF06310.1 hypothetical protein [Clostridium gasigenes]QSW20195.1 hypothetical protein J1C67_03040 [Clostridium gasigenes]SDP35459.1 hypothetical protein SAMN04488529_104111 [Clostridium gasigenes]
MSEKEVVVENEEVSNIDNTIEETEVVSESVEEILVKESLVEDIQVEDKQKVKDNCFIKELLVGVIDQIVVIAGALATLLVFNLILKIFGYYVSEKETIFLIIYILINIIYVPVCKMLKLKETVGRKILLNK